MKCPILSNMSTCILFHASTWISHHNSEAPREKLIVILYCTNIGEHSIHLLQKDGFWRMTATDVIRWIAMGIDKLKNVVLIPFIFAIRRWIGREYPQRGHLWHLYRVINSFLLLANANIISSYSAGQWYRVVAMGRLYRTAHHISAMATNDNTNLCIQYNVTLTARLSVFLK